MPLTATDQAWFIGEIRRLDPDGAVVAVVTTSGVTQLHYSDRIRSDETLVRPATAEELVRGLTVCLLCSTQYGYAPERLYLERTYSIGRPSSSTAQIDLILYFEEEDGSETAFAMWEMKAPDTYNPSSDPLIADQLFNVAPLVSPSLLVYATVKPQVADIDCLTIDYTAYKTYSRWVDAGRPAT